MLVDVLRLALEERTDELRTRLRKVVDPPRRRQAPRLTEPGRAAVALLLNRPSGLRPSGGVRAAPAGSAAGVAPTSLNLPLLDPPPAVLEPVLEPDDRVALDGVVREFGARKRLSASGLTPTRTVLLSGPPGVGKSMSIAYLASALDRPLLRVEPSDVIGSLLGESARLLTAVFARAKETGAVLALDEIDALAKRRDDAYDVGEFKRFVTTLLVELDRWPGDAPLIAATNHLELLDPALERRFELHVRLGLPGAKVRGAIIEQGLAGLSLDANDETVDALVDVTAGATGADLARLVQRAARHAVLDDEPLDRTLLIAAAPRKGDAPRQVRERFAAAAQSRANLTTRQIGELLECSHTAARRLALAGAAQSPESKE